MRLRNDLQTIFVPGNHRGSRIVFDGISGAFHRISEQLWQSLHSGQARRDQWDQAVAAGWTPHRVATPKKRFSILAIRLPIGSIDRLAKRISPLTDFLFSKSAIRFWLIVIATAVVSVGLQLRWAASVATALPLFLSRTSPVFVGFVFVFTKFAHELAHAVACRRLGFRCGKIGILFLLGMPCPYCDVTQIWQSPKAIHRAAVMMAGIYIELIIAALATFVWLASESDVVQLHAMNVMLVCGVSTILFNANPLMRYDGYYVLSDWLDSVNLRQEAIDANKRFWFDDILKIGSEGRTQTNTRTGSLAAFHLASIVYRVLILGLIATAILYYLRVVHLEGVGKLLVLAMLVLMMKRVLSAVFAASAGKRSWSGTSVIRRGLILGGLGTALVAIIAVPLPRRLITSGRVEASDAAQVFLASEGTIDRVHCDAGDRVNVGDPIVDVRNPDDEVRQKQYEGQLRLASLRSGLAKRDAIERTEAVNYWRSLESLQDSAFDNLQAMIQKNRSHRVKAPVQGIVLPSLDDHKSLPHGSTRGREAKNAVRIEAENLRSLAGRRSSPGRPWCQISSTGNLYAVLKVDAKYRGKVELGDVVRVIVSTSPDSVCECEIESISDIRLDRDLDRRAAFDVLCKLPIRLSPLFPTDSPGSTSNVNRDWMSHLGAGCTGSLEMPRRSLATDFAEFVSAWLQ